MNEIDLSQNQEKVLAERQKDIDAINRIRAGDESAWEELYARHRPIVLSTAYKIVGYEDRENIAQKAFMNAFQYFNTFTDDISFKAWINTIAKRVCYDYLKDIKKKPIDFTLSELDNEAQGKIKKYNLRLGRIVDSKPLVLNWLVAEELTAKIKAALALSPRITENWEVICEAFEGKITFRECAEIVGISKYAMNRIKVRVEKAAADVTGRQIEKEPRKAIMRWDAWWELYKKALIARRQQSGHENDRLLTYVEGDDENDRLVNWFGTMVNYGLNSEKLRPMKEFLGDDIFTFAAAEKERRGPKKSGNSIDSHGQSAGYPRSPRASNESLGLSVFHHARRNDSSHMTRQIL